MDRDNATRRTYLTGLACGFAAGLAGCNTASRNEQSHSPENEDASPDQSPEDEPATTQEMPDTPAHWPFVHGTAGNANYAPNAKGPVYADQPSLSVTAFGDELTAGGLSATADPIVANDLLYVGTDDVIQAIDVAAGEIVSSLSVDEPVTGLGYHRDHILATTPSGRVYGLVADLATVEWEQTLDTGHPFPPTARDGLAVVGGEDGLAGVSATTGDIQWQADVPARGVNDNRHPIPIGEAYAFVYDGETLVAIDLENGGTQPLRDQLNPSEDDTFEITASPVYRDGALFVTSTVEGNPEYADHAQLTKISTESLEREFQKTSGTVPAVPLAVTDEFVLTCDSRGAVADGRFGRFDTESGDRKSATEITDIAVGDYKTKIVADKAAAYVVSNRMVGAVDYRGDSVSPHDQTTVLPEGEDPNTNQSAGVLGFSRVIVRGESESDSQSDGTRLSAVEPSF